MQSRSKPCYGNLIARDAGYLSSSDRIGMTLLDQRELTT